MYSPGTGTFTPTYVPDNDNDEDDEGYITKDKVVHHKGYDTHTIERIPKPLSKAEKGSNDVAIILTAIVVVIGVVAILTTIAKSDD